MTGQRTTHPRRGATLVLMALLTIPLLAMVAFAVDYGYLLKERTDLQRYADAVALAAVQDLVPAIDGSQDLGAVRATVRTYVAANLGNAFKISNADIEIGRYDPNTIYSKVTLLNTGVYDTVRVTLRRDGNVNSSVSLFFAPIIGVRNSSVVACSTAVLQKAKDLPPGADVLPFGIPQDVWDNLKLNDVWIGYGDGKMLDGLGGEIPGNWGTVDIGNANNSTSDLGDQILNGLRQSDLDSLHNDNRIPTNTHIDSSQPVWVNADPGLSSGMKSAVRAIHGQARIVPIFDQLQAAGGNNLQYHINKWGAVDVVDSNWGGAKNTYVKLRKSHIYDGDLRPHPNLGNTTNTIDHAYTSPVLVE